MHITCYQCDPDLNYIGGTLFLQCCALRVLDEAGRELPANN